ncbi:MAG: ATP-dependent protease ATPase subunit HslU, partial [bacterium]
DRLLDLLLPPLRKPKMTGVPEEDAENEKKEEERFKETREKLRKQLVSGKLEEKFVEVSIKSKSSPMMEIFSGPGIEEVGINMQEMMEGMGGGRSKKKKVTVREARGIILEEEMQKLIDMDKVKQEAVEKVENSAIIFIDEIDKVASTESKGSGADVSREGVQRDILPIVEGTTVITKHGPVKTDHILFVAAGAFHVSKPSDLIPELQGRFPIRVELESLTEEDFIQILKEPENSLIKQYTQLLKTDEVALEFDEGSIETIAKFAFEVNETTENIGARRLHTIIEKVLEEILFDAPYGKKEKKSITKEFVETKINELVKDRDLSRYIL